MCSVKDTAAKANPKLTLLPLIALIFYEVSGGPFGVEDSVRAGGGPLLSLLGFLIFPLIWSIPEALITAELATSFPENGGYVLWISAAFGPFWGFQEGFWKWFSGVMDNALYPVLFLDYLKHSFPIFNRLIARIPALLGITISLTYLNFRGLNIVGFSAVALAIFSLCPFLVMGEVENPSRTFPKALLGAVVLVVSWYLIPLLADYCNLFQVLLGMRKKTVLSEYTTLNKPCRTPTISILCSATRVVFLSWMSFQEIVEFLHFLYSIGMLLEFAAFIRLRIKKLDLHRPYKIPLQTFGVTVLCLSPALLLVFVMCLASLKTFLVIGSVIILGVFLYPTVVLVKERKWGRFVSAQVVPSHNCQEALPIVSPQHQEVVDEASVSLLSDLSSIKKEQESSEIMSEGALKLEKKGLLYSCTNTVDVTYM
ncbi:hypothetical protein HHK36_002713 [Tetracentron sinense]|uniref:Uncharacterized protein n=1 Tax=Tetracentron sinense TaxID=13715 RepID=A0A835DNL0_TETSI|nr:hypothetical protein HHK36_002713 [Tetracentron sinense]